MIRSLARAARVLKIFRPVAGSVLIAVMNSSEWLKRKAHYSGRNNALRTIGHCEHPLHNPVPIHGVPWQAVSGLSAIDNIPFIGIHDPFSSLVHLGGAVAFAILGIGLLERGRGDRLRSAALLVYVFSVVFALLASGSFHAADPESSARTILHRADHVGIFLLIAGTYTPIHIIQFKGLMRWGVLGLVWSAAIAGILVRWMLPESVTTGVGILIYLGLGWVGLGSAIGLYRFVGFKPLLPLIGGALAYTLGAILEFAHVPVLVPRIVGHHEVFHVFVLIGVSLHWQYIRSIVVQAPIVDLYGSTVPVPQGSAAT